MKNTKQPTTKTQNSTKKSPAAPVTGREPTIPHGLAVNVIDYMDSARESVEQMIHAHLDPDGDLTGVTADWDKHVVLLLMALRVTSDEMQKVVDLAKYGPRHHAAAGEAVSA